MPATYKYHFGESGSQYGLQGRLAKTVITESDAGEWTTWYDHANRPVRQKRADGSILTYHYDGSQLKRADLAGQDGNAVELMAFAYDGLGRKAWEWGPTDPAHFTSRGGIPAAGDYTHRWSYSRAGRTRRTAGPVDDSTSQPISMTRFQYTPHGFPYREHAVGSFMDEYSYDVAHGFPRLKSVSRGTTPDVRTTDYSYHPTGLFISEVRTAGPRSGGTVNQDESLVVRLQNFDPFGTPIEISLSEESGGSPRDIFVQSMVTDVNGRVETSSVTQSAEPTNKTTYTYFKNGQISSAVSDRSGGLLFDRQASGQLIGIQAVDKNGSRGDSLVQIRRWNARARPTEFDLANGVRLELVYDNMGRIAEHLVSKDAQSWRHRTFTFNARGLLEREAVAHPDKQHENIFTYTREGWLANETREVDGTVTASSSYAYDAAGNRIGRHHMDGTRDVFEYGSTEPGETSGAALLRVNLRNEGWQNVQWDGFGGIIRDHRGYQLERNVLGLVDKIWDPSGYLTTEITRDPIGRPVAIRSLDKIRTHVWGHPTSSVYPLATRDETGGHMVYAAIAHNLLGRVADGNAEVAVTDPRGNLILNDQNFLDLASAYESGISRPTNGLAFVFGGQEMIDQVPYMSAQPRLYDPDIGLFASVDPIGLAGGRHRFRYAANNPLTNIDPWGTDGDDAVEGGSEDFDPPSPDEDSDEPAKADLSLTDFEPTSGWEVQGSEIVDEFSNRYPIDDIEHSTIGTSDGGEAPITEVYFHDAEGNGHVVAFPEEGPSGEETDERTGGLRDAGDLLEGEGFDSAVDDLGSTDDDRSTGGSDMNPSEDTAGQSNGGGGDSQSGEPDTPMPENFRGSRDQLAGLLGDGYSVDARTGLLMTPSGNFVIPGINDAQNPLPHKVIINIAADHMDDALNGGISGSILQATGVWGGNGSPANDFIKDNGFGYTPSEKPREAIAETTMEIVGAALAAPASAAAGARAQATMQRGCSGPAGRLPSALKTVLNVSCFVGDTEVAVSEGLRRIDEIAVGDKVVCRDEVRQQTRLCEVARVFETENWRILTIHVVDDRGKQEQIGTTENHRFFVDGAGWMEAGKLQPGDRLVGSSGGMVNIVKSELSTKAETTYNLEVADAHTYFVGEARVLVHNGGPKACPKKRGPRSKALNLTQASQKLNKKATSWKDVTVQELKDLQASGSISKTQLSRTLRGNSRSARNRYINDMQDALGKDKIMARVGDQIGYISKADAKKGRTWHMGHFGTSLKEMIQKADGSKSVTDFRNKSWSSTILEYGPLNYGKGAMTTHLDLPH